MKIFEWNKSLTSSSPCIIVANTECSSTANASTEGTLSSWNSFTKYMYLQPSVSGVQPVIRDWESWIIGESLYNFTGQYDPRIWVIINIVNTGKAAIYMVLEQSRYFIPSFHKHVSFPFSESVPILGSGKVCSFHGVILCWIRGVLRWWPMRIVEENAHRKIFWQMTLDQNLREVGDWDKAEYLLS